LARPRTRIVVAGALWLALAVVVAATWQRGWRSLYGAGLVPARSHGGDVVFVVLDNVRADRTSLCGYAHPTTPTLATLAATPAAHTCRAYAPGSWTLPSHASYFTGVDALEHRAHEVPSRPSESEGTSFAPTTAIPSRGLDEKLPTLAEQMVAKGFQAGAVSANPVVSRAAGLLRGFQFAREAPAFGALGGPRLRRSLETLLREDVDPLGGPLFLFVNVADAHQPWEGVPRGHAWLRSHPELFYNSRDPNNHWRQFFRGSYQGGARQGFLAHLSDVYDYAVQRADIGLDIVLTALRAHGYCRRDCRIVVTSDHGEMLGEHGMIDHGFVPWEENARVPVVAAFAGAPTLPEPMAARDVYFLVRDGALPAASAPVTQVAWPHPIRSSDAGPGFYEDWIALLWRGAEKLAWVNGTTRRYDLGADPGEAAPQEVIDGIPSLLTELSTAVQAERSEGNVDPGVIQALEAGGYLDPVDADQLRQGAGGRGQPTRE
jgi:hypothetical protein